MLRGRRSHGGAVGSLRTLGQVRVQGTGAGTHVIRGYFRSLSSGEEPNLGLQADLRAADELTDRPSTASRSLLSVYSGFPVTRQPHNYQLDG